MTATDTKRPTDESDTDHSDDTEFEFTTEHAIAFLDDDNPADQYRDSKSAELSVDVSGGETEITLTAEFDEPERLREADIYSVQIVPKVIPDE
ncbi:hypothetical protein [Halosimplex marinum]|uniref:hypothetical protein n=1 Tax=Halosimplex marinum TaxID=3396620 RepID=UPI003F549DDA